VAECVRLGMPIHLAIRAVLVPTFMIMGSMATALLASNAAVRMLAIFAKPIFAVVDGRSIRGG
jgi:hypothetical protein